jgi:hypothetical protein
MPFAQALGPAKLGVVMHDTTRWLAAILAVASTACGTSIGSLVERGEYYRACEAADNSYSRELVDALANKSNATLAITPWSSAQTLSEAKITTPAKSWLVLASELGLASGPGELVELFVSAPELRAPGWQSLGGLGLGNSYRLLTGKTMPSPGTSATSDDLLGWARGVITGDAAARAKIEGVFSSPEMPDDLALAERLRELLTTECRATPGTRCRTARMLVPAESRPSAASAIAFTLRYGLTDPQSGAHCGQAEHVVVPLAQAGDLPDALAKTFSGTDVSLATLRSRSKVYGLASDDPFAEDEGRGALP